jgi:hypothetical protein
MPTAGRELYDRGWRQGSRIAVNARQGFHRAFEPIETQEHDLPEGMDLVLATQDCDLVRAEERLPLLEGIGCCEDPERAAAIQLNDARYFVLEPAVGLIADRGYGAFFTRESLALVPPPVVLPCGGDAARRRRFARWLGARYDRPAFPDEAVDAIQRPLAATVRKLYRPGHELHGLNDDLHEIRIAGDLDSGAPFTVTLIFVLREGADEEAASLLIARLLEEAGFAVEGDSIEDGDNAAVVIRTWVAAPPSRLSVAAYNGSIAIPLAYESYRGDEVVGAEPLDAESL